MDTVSTTPFALHSLLGSSHSPCPEVSQKAAASLAGAGFEASFLQGDWRPGLPTIRRKPEWRVPGASRWITRERPKIDRVACPWLVRRFIDPAASFDYVPGVAITHRGERCSFDALLEDFELRDAAAPMTTRCWRKP